MSKSAPMNTIVYKNGGDYLGTHSGQNISYWRWYGKQKNQKWIYKGYRNPRLYSSDKKMVVVVFDKKRWDNAEIARRKANGFLGIREYRV